jgi:predicted transcriptional regulator
MHRRRIPMSDQSKPEDTVRDLAAVERQTDLTVLATMLHNESWPWSLDELGRELQDHTMTEDAVRRLVESGLAHRLGDFVFPSRAAQRGVEIELGTA